MPDFMSEIQFGQRVMVKFGKLSFDKPSAFGSKQHRYRDENG